MQSLTGSRIEQSELENYSSSFVIHSDSESDENEENDAHKQLTDCYFEQWMLEEDKRNVSWLLSEFDPDSDVRDQLLL